MKICMKSIIVILVCVSVSLVFFGTNVFAGSEETFEKAFPDPKFREYITETILLDLGASESGVISADHIKVMSDWTYLNVSDRNIKDLTGISFFKNLLTLNCSSNQITKLDVSSNAFLTDLNCSSNQLSELNVSENVVLTRLSCDNNQLDLIDLSKNPMLISLSCTSNNMESLDLAQNVVLELLNCEKNAIETLDVSNLPLLSSLTCSSNNLSELDVSTNGLLRYLYCDNNRLTYLDLSMNENIVAIEAHTQVTHSETTPQEIEKRWVVELTSLIGDEIDVALVTSGDDGILFAGNKTLVYEKQPQSIKVIRELPHKGPYSDTVWTMDITLHLNAQKSHSFNWKIPVIIAVAVLVTGSIVTVLLIKKKRAQRIDPIDP